MTNLDGDISLDQQLALKVAATRLAQKFDGVYGAETIERFLNSSYAEFADRSSIPNFLPLLAERFAEQRLNALAKVEGHHSDGNRRCSSSACTTPVGRRWRWASSSTTPATRPSRGRAAPNPASRSTPQPSQAMAERGIDISAEYPKPWTDEVVRAADAVITMGCGDACPIFPGKRYEEWTLDDPAGQDVAAVRPIRDEIEQRVLILLHELGVTPQAEPVRGAN